MITSTTNRQVKFVNALLKKAKTRREEDLFVAEGLRICAELPKERIHTLFVSESFLAQSEAAGLQEGVRRVECVSDEVFAALSDTKTPQGVLALVKQNHFTLPELLPGPGEDPALIMVLERLQDPGNLGTILRAGEGAGVTGILMDRDTADIYSPKVIRSTMGSVMRVPFVVTEDLPGALSGLKKAGVKLFAAHLKAESDYDRADFCGPVGFLIGNEAGGLTEQTAALADCRIRIPMKGSVESLNAAVAASVLMFEASRQRRLNSADERLPFTVRF